MEYRIMKNFPDLHRLERNIYISKTDDRQSKAQKTKAETNKTAGPPEAAGLPAPEC